MELKRQRQFIVATRKVFLNLQIYFVNLLLQSIIEAAKAWACWEGETISIKGPSSRPARFEEDSFADAFARIECHYFVNKGFFPEDGWLLKKAEEKLGGVPGIIVHGRYDVVTPIGTAWKLTKAWPDAKLHIVPDAGHSSLDPGIVDQLITATRSFAKKFK